MGRYAKARQLAERARELDPDDTLPSVLLGDVHKNLGDLYAGRREHLEAIDEYEKAIREYMKAQQCPMYGQYVRTEIKRLNIRIERERLLEMEEF
jgi:hypothetical protein